MNTHSEVTKRVTAAKLSRLT